jgi:hypothetical protein
MSMALSPQQRQRKIERRRAKTKVKQRQIARRASLGVAARLELVAAAPVLHCAHSEELWEQGIGNVLLSRELENGNVAYGVFLVDAYCLGVKNAMGGFLTRAEYDEYYERLLHQFGLRELKPPCARKLVEGAVAYAADLGFDPHADYRRFRAIFGTIDPSECTQEFEYGLEGKPCFVAGPYDAPHTAGILKTLESRCGPGNYDCFIPANPDVLVLNDQLPYDEQSRSDLP